MQLSDKQKERALEIFDSYSKLSVEVSENANRLANLKKVQEDLLKRLQTIRDSEESWVNEIAEELNESPETIKKALAEFILQK